MKNKLVLLFAIILGLGIISFVILKFPNQTKIGKSQVEQKNNSSIWYKPRTDEKGEVVVEAVPTKLSTKENSEFIVKFTTHSVDLNYDLENIAILTDDKGNQYKSISWTGGKGGHHIEGTLTFSKLSQDASAVTLTIPGIDNQDRIFEWELN